MTAAAKPANAGRQGRLLYGFNQAALALCTFIVCPADFHEFTHDVSAGLPVQWLEFLARLQQACRQRLPLR